MLPCFANNEREKALDNDKIFAQKTRVGGPTSNIAPLMKPRQHSRTPDGHARRGADDDDKTPVRDYYLHSQSVQHHLVWNPKEMVERAQIDKPKKAANHHNRTFDDHFDR